MRLKVFLVPAIVIIAVVYAIWMFVPKITELKDEFESIDQAKKDLAIIVEKINKSEYLRQDLMTKAEKQNVILRYLPVDKQTENILNNLNQIASDSQVVISDISMSEKDLTGSGQENAGTLKSINMRFLINGEYGKIKSVLEKLNNNKRSNEIISLRILNETGLGKENLKAEMDMQFNYLEKITMADVNSKILENGKFDMSTIDKIESIATTDFAETALGQTGKSNPFIP